MHGHDHNSKHKSSGAIEVRTIEVRTKTDIKDDLVDCTKTEKDDYRNY